MNLVVVNTECANLASVCYALERLGYQPEVTADAARINAADKIILPGVGTAQAAMRNLRRLELVEVIQQLRQPVLGICLGMQLMTEHSEEGDTVCLGVIPTRTKRLNGDGLPLPHMGWNQVLDHADCPLLKHVPSAEAYFYFVHSFAVPVDEFTSARADYGQSFAAIIRHKNFYGAQFHPERSGPIGAQLLKNFLEL